MVITEWLSRVARPLLLSAVLLVAACSGSDGDEVAADLGDGDASADSAASDAEQASSTTEPSTTVEPSTAMDLSTTRSSEAPVAPSTLSAAEADEQLGEDLMAALLDYIAAADACTSDILNCDIEGSLTPLLGGDFRSLARSFYQDMVDAREQFDLTGRVYLYRRHSQIFDNPVSYALETCYESKGGDVVRVNEDGSTDVVDSLTADVAFEQFVLELQADGSFTIVERATNPEQVGAETCDEFRN
jgi:hypothetical protein